MEERKSDRSMANLKYCQVVHGAVHDKHQGIPMMRSVTLILGCCIVLFLRKGDLNELTETSKGPWKRLAEFEDEFSQTWEDDANQKVDQSLSVIAIDPVIDHMIERPLVFDHSHTSERSQNLNPNA
jgi:hypothetical protein